jgi:hypothetical protein
MAHSKMKPGLEKTKLQFENWFHLKIPKVFPASCCVSMTLYIIHPGNTITQLGVSYT